MERKRREKEIYRGVWLGKFVERKLVGLGFFLHEPTITFSSHIVEKTKEENQEKEMDQKNVQHVFSLLSTFFIILSIFVFFIFFWFSYLKGKMKKMRENVFWSV